MGAATDAPEKAVPVVESAAEKAEAKAAIDQAKVDSEVAAFRELAKQAGRRQEAIDGLLGLEKQGRVAEDVVTTRKACSAVLEVRWRLGGGGDACSCCCLFLQLFRERCWSSSGVSRQSVSATGLPAPAAASTNTARGGSGG
jgi:hypothetical protein